MADGKQPPTNKPKGGKQKRPRKSIEEQIEETNRKLHELRVKEKIETCDNPREAKALLRAVKILRNFDEDDAAESVQDVVNEMCGLDEDGDEDEE